MMAMKNKIGLSSFDEDKMRARLRAQGLPKQEIHKRVEQSRHDRKVSALEKAPPRPQAARELNRALDNQLRFLQAQRMKKQQRELLERKTVEKAFRQHPKQATQAAAQGLGRKTPEQKAEKKARKKAKMRKYAKEAAEESWWKPLTDMGAELIPKLLPMLIGLGDYEETEVPMKIGQRPVSNSLLAASSRGSEGYQVPFMHRVGEKVRVQHREFIGDVYSSTSAFTVLSFPLNPGMNETFPWLSPISMQFTSYRLMGMCADFVSQGSDYANSAGLGYVALATQYDTARPGFTNKRDMLNYEFADACKPSRNMCHWIECRPSDIPNDEKFVRAGNIPSGTDIRLYDHGTLYLAVGGNTAGGSVIGQLWVTYDVEFYLPQAGYGSSGTINYAGYTTFTGVAASTPTGTGSYTTDARNSMTLTTASNGWVFPNGIRGDYKCVVLWNGTAGAAGSGLSTPTVSSGNSINEINWGTAVAGNYTFYCNFLVTVNTDACVLAFPGSISALPTGTASVYFIVTQVPIGTVDIPIFDWAGRNFQDRYSKFMKRFDDGTSPLETLKASEITNPFDLRSIDLFSEVYRRVSGMQFTSADPDDFRTEGHYWMFRFDNEGEDDSCSSYELYRVDDANLSLTRSIEYARFTPGNNTICSLFDNSWDSLDSKDFIISCDMIYKSPNLDAFHCYPQSTTTPSKT
jgi:hypothetical protein